MVRTRNMVLTILILTAQCIIVDYNGIDNGNDIGRHNVTHQLSKAYSS